MQDNRNVSCLMAAFRKGHVQLVEWMVKRVTQFPSDEEILRIITTTIDNDLLPKCQLCKEIICAAKDHKTAEANKRAAYLLKELDMEKNREDLKRAAAAKKREKKKQKKREQRRADGGSTDSYLEEQVNVVSMFLRCYVCFFTMITHTYSRIMATTIEMKRATPCRQKLIQLRQRVTLRIHQMKNPGLAQ